MADRRLGQVAVAWLTLAALGVVLAIVARDHLHEARAGASLEWRHPWAGALAAAGLIVAWAGFHLRRQRSASLGFTRVGLLARARPGLRAYLAELPTALRILAIATLAAALARPQTYRTIEHTVDTVDIMIVFDLSKSMDETDLPRDRLDAAQRVVRRFVRQRSSDRVGLVVFAQAALLQCPLTLDMALLDQVVANLRIGDVPEYGTAIGDGLGLGLAQLRRSDARSKIVILLSDGDSNVETAYTPEEAAALAQRMGVKVFTMLIGAENSGFFGGRSVDPDTLRSIASTTGGEFFPAVDQASFERSFARVREQLDTTRRVVKERVPDQELFAGLVLLALGLVLLELALASTWLRRWP
ncbi:MAG: VWA domain-containing protein [Kofleriaceae bacterium]